MLNLLTLRKSSCSDTIQFENFFLQFTPNFGVRFKQNPSGKNLKRVMIYQGLSTCHHKIDKLYCTVIVRIKQTLEYSNLKSVQNCILPFLTNG